MLKIRLILLSSILCFSVNQMNAQPELGECDREIVEVSQNQFSRAKKAWEAKNPSELKRNLELALRTDENNPHALYYYGEFQARSGNLKMAEAIWMKLLSICPDYKAEVTFKLGVILLENGNNEKGLAMLQRYVEHPERDKNLVRQARKILGEEDLLAQLISNPVPFDPSPLANICTEADEYLAVTSPDGRYVFFTRRTKERDRFGGAAIDKMIVKESFSKAERTANGNFDRGGPLPEPFNTGLNEGGPSINANNTELYFTVCRETKDGYRNCDIYFSRKSGFYWSVPESVGDHINKPDSWESQPSVSSNGDRLYFASNRKGGIGGIDIYVCTRNEDASWSEPRNLGPEINTGRDEKSPFIHSDGQTLYFSSNGHPGVGGFDVFFSKSRDGVEWSEPQNIGYPINTENDDLGLTVSLDGKKGFFSSNTLGGKNEIWNVYQFDIPASIRPKTVTLVRGRMVDENDEPNPDAKLVLRNTDDNSTQTLDIDEITGEYAAVVVREKGVDHMITVEKEGAAFSSKYISSDVVLDDPVIEADLEVRQIKSGEEYRLNDIVFATNSFELDRAARVTIEAFADFLKNNPQVNVEIQGHTDNVGRDQDNLVLSKQRAKVVYDFLRDRGIKASRLSHNGYGPNKPVADNDTEEGRAKNRRTVFVIR